MTMTVYLLHFKNLYYHAQHYLGSTTDLDRRMAQHRGGTGSPLVAAIVNQDDNDFVLARTWPGGRPLERQLKNRKNGRKLCPLCSRVEETP